MVVRDHPLYHLILARILKKWVKQYGRPIQKHCRWQHGHLRVRCVCTCHENWPSSCQDTSNYGKAINYYEASLKVGGQTTLRYDLAELLLRLKQYDKAEKVLKQAIEQDGQDLETMVEHTKYLILLAKVYNQMERLDDAQNTLQKARDMQARVLKRVQVEQPDAINDQKELAASICSQLAEHAANQRDTETAIKFYKEALVYSENDSKRSLDLAGLYLMTEDLDSCQHQLMTLLKNDNDNDSATIMLADLMFRRNEYDSAMYHFQQLLNSKPDSDTIGGEVFESVEGEGVQVSKDKTDEIMAARQLRNFSAVIVYYIFICEKF
ncbi:Tetratricopeptide repeat protein 21B [Bulinus truncatus]|nr:Tetratricopeptide repeat protein 21B [Bulinus truncatus]